MRPVKDILVRSWPRVSKEECAFYHTMDLPSGRVDGQWDLRGRLKEYIGNTDVSGKRVLDYGCASGFLTFEMERMGAKEVVSFDADTSERIAFLPIQDHPFTTQPTQWRVDTNNYLTRLKNSYWFAHHDLKSSAACYYGDAYQLPTELGGFDVVVVSQILIHLRDPISAIGAAASVCDDILVITEGMDRSEEKIGRFHASAAGGGPPYIWWQLSVGMVKEVVQMCGFEVVSLEFANYSCVEHEYVTGELEIATLVARRVAKDLTKLPT